MAAAVLYIADNYSVAARVVTRFFFQAEDGIRDLTVTGVQTCALPISTLSRPPTAFAQRSTGLGTANATEAKRNGSMNSVLRTGCPHFLAIGFVSSAHSLRVLPLQSEAFSLDVLHTRGFQSLSELARRSTALVGIIKKDVEIARRVAEQSQQQRDLSSMMNPVNCRVLHQVS